MIDEKVLIEQCSLTLSSLKTASLFTVKINNIDKVNTDIANWNNKFYDKGVKLVVLRVGTNSALIYLFREDMLKEDLGNENAKNILLRYGYNNLNVENSIKKLSQRLSTYKEFPHEIGLFLGYPPKDVEGFICNGGRNCNLCKYWKVYGDKDEALLRFSKYDKCKQVYRKLWENGKDILQLTVKKQSVA